MPVTEVRDAQPQEGADAQEDPMVVRIKSKVKGGPSRTLILREDDEEQDIVHSGTVDKDGNDLFNETGPGGFKMVTAAGLLVNHLGQEIDKEGKVKKTYAPDWSYVPKS